MNVVLCFLVVIIQCVFVKTYNEGVTADNAASTQIFNSTDLYENNDKITSSEASVTSEHNQKWIISKSSAKDTSVQDDSTTSTSFPDTTENSLWTSVLRDFNQITNTRVTREITDLDESYTTISVTASESTTDFSQSTTTEISCPETPESIQNLIGIPGNFNISLKWTPPETNTECIKEYVVYFNDAIYTNTSETELIIIDLAACDKYNISIAVSDEIYLGEKVTRTYETTIPDPFTYGVKSISTNSSKNALDVTWQLAEDTVKKCVISYVVEVNTGANSSNYTVQKPSLQLSPLVWCLNYTFTVFPLTEINKGEGVSKSYSQAAPTNPPECNKFSSNQSSVTVTWQTDDESINACPIHKIVTKCYAPSEKNGDYPWIVTSNEETLNISKPSTDHTYTMTISGLSPFTNYTCEGSVVNSAEESQPNSFNVTTKEDVPSQPESLEIIISNDTNQITLKWKEPSKIPGILLKYEIGIIDQGPGPGGRDCSKNSEYLIHETKNQRFDFDKSRPYHNYTFTVYGVVNAGKGDATTTSYITPISEPDNVTNLTIIVSTCSENEIYNGTVVFDFKIPCTTNGPFSKYQININGNRGVFNDSSSITIPEVLQNNTTIKLKPDYHYEIEISVTNSNFTSSRSITYDSEPGVPVIGEIKPPSSDYTTKAHFLLSKNVFDDTNGNISYYALFLSTQNTVYNATKGCWDGEGKWPVPPPGYVQLTPKLWNPFKNEIEEYNFVIGGEEKCKDNYCNLPLKDDTGYFLIVRALTRKTYADSTPLYFKTEAEKIGLIVGLILGLLLLFIVIVLGVIYWRRHRESLTHIEEKRLSTNSSEPIICKKFLDYYENASRENYNIMKTQYANLNSLCKEINLPITYGLLPENKRKNRYTNILPYDETRVKLNIEEDDEISSDYINASYIKGYSGQVEYIATQGPLESTCKDFWRMVFQENVTVIVMVSQFIEQSKEKCFQYFPNNHENLKLSESFEVKCSTELHFGTYCIRTIQVRKDREQRNVIHMQFLEWPDFGVPQGTDNMLQFCHQMREKANLEGGLIAVHCSAGVGRTGTLIALDILLQTIKDHRDINIYKIVLDLRKQRTNMVQTEKQYIFLYTCVKDSLETGRIQSRAQSQDHIYENMEIMQSSMKKNLIKTESESAL